jgi:hypothetical protein
MRDLPRYPRNWCKLQDKFRVKDDLKRGKADCYIGDRCIENSVVEDMPSMAGKVVTIAYVYDDGQVRIEEFGWTWNPAMLDIPPINKRIGINMDAFDELLKV